MTESETLYNDIFALLAGIGVCLVDLTVTRRKTAVLVHAVILGASGTGIDECSRSHRLMQPRLETLLGETDFFLEVASPGIDREIRSSREYAVFAGKGVRIHLREGGEPVLGRIGSSDSAGVTVATKAGDRTIAYDDISKAKLDYSQEGV